MLPEFGLTLHELAELIRRAGRAAGFIVESEYKVRSGKIDWVWLMGESLQPALAFEIEGRDVDARSVAADIEKFRECGASINVMALFQVDHNRTPKGLPSGLLPPQSRVRRLAADFPMEIVLDEELMIAGGIEQFQARAFELSCKCK